MPTTAYRIALINMPFAQLSMPSIALTQLAAVLEQRFGRSVEVCVHYLNLDFAQQLDDLDLYNHTRSATGLMTGIGDWFFRHCAFPEAADNANAYYGRYYFSADEETRTLRQRIEEKRTEAGPSLDRLIDRYALLDADLVGFTTLFSQTVASLAMARRIKDRHPDVLTAIGGAACDGVMGMEIAEHVPQIDAVFSGPALESFPQFVDGLLQGDAGAGDGINGVFTRANRSQWPGRSPNPDIAMLGDRSDINASIPLAYDSFLDAVDTAFPNGEVHPLLLFETSRGCWWAEHAACSFCGLNGPGQQHQAMRPDAAVRHIESLYHYVPRCRMFMAVDTLLPKSYTRNAFPRLSPPPRMTMFYEIKPDVTPDEIRTLVNAGVRAFQPGIESLATSTLKRMRKGTTAFQNIAFLKACSAHPLRLDWNLLAFSPGEEESVYEKALRDIPHLVHLPPPSGAYPVGFVRFSRYAENPDAYGLKLEPQDFYALTFPFDEESVRNLAYHFVDRNADTEHINAWLDRLNAAVAHWKERWLGADDRPQARLCFASGDRGWAVHDSRSGHVVETEITDAEKRMLDALDRPRTLSGLQDEFGDRTDAALARFGERGWLFAEDGRLLSLVT